MSRVLRLPPENGPDPVVRLIITHWMLGAALGMMCGGALLWLDIAGLRSLLFRADRVMWEGIVLLFGGLAITFGGVVCASAVMTVSRNDDDPGAGLAAVPESDVGAFRPAARTAVSEANRAR
jgi:hypothetical protein